MAVLHVYGRCSTGCAWGTGGSPGRLWWGFFWCRFPPFLLRGNTAACRKEKQLLLLLCFCSSHFMWYGLGNLSVTYLLTHSSDSGSVIHRDVFICKQWAACPVYPACDPSAAHSVFLPPSHPVLLILLTFTVLEIALYSENINSSLAKLANLISVLPFFFEKNLFLLSLRPRMCIFPVYLDKLILSAEILSKS